MTDDTLLVIDADTLARLLNRAHDGEEPIVLLAELYAGHQNDNTIEEQRA